jgi:ABC-type sulfate/molybdate transport systems ATPase subunit
MTRETFIKKWLDSPLKEYDEQCRNEMRDDLDKVIDYSQNKTKSYIVHDVIKQNELLLAFCKKNYLKFNLNNAEHAQKLIDDFLNEPNTVCEHEFKKVTKYCSICIKCGKEN